MADRWVEDSRWPTGSASQAFHVANRTMFVDVVLLAEAGPCQLDFKQTAETLRVAMMTKPALQPRDAAYDSNFQHLLED